MHRSTKPLHLNSGTTPKRTPNRLLTPKAHQDENTRPGTSSKRKPIVPCNVLKRQIREETSSSSEHSGPGVTPKTPLTTSNIRTKTPTTTKTPSKLNVKSPSTIKSSVNVTPKRTRQPDSTKTTPTKRDRSASRSVLFEFSDDILVTPGRQLLTEQGTPASLSVKTSSTISIVNQPAPQCSSSQHSSFNRSQSASSLSHSKSSDSGNGLLRSHSEVKLSSAASNANPIHSDTGETSRLTVGVRVRPLHYRESGNTIFVTGNEIRVASDLGSVHSFTYDYCFPSTGVDSSSQKDVYDALVKPLVDTAFQGYNACLFAYGQTGSGKTFSMMGPMHANNGLSPDNGIIPRFCQEVLTRVSTSAETDTDALNAHLSAVTTTVEISYLEVYNEKIHDLLAPGSEQLKVREHPVYGPYVVDLSKHVTSTYSELQHWINTGNQKRATAATEMNDKSSRSHSLFTVVLTQTFAQVGADGVWSHDQTRRSQINLVDLAGSERIAHSSVTTGRLREGVSINKSLLTLGKVMTSLIDKRPHVPYRDSVLTWLLKDSLGGNSRTTMLATISPSSAHIEETLSTLRYASQARSIINTVRVNEAPQDKLIRELRAEIERLKNSEPITVPHPLAVPLVNAEQINNLQLRIKHLEKELETKRKESVESKVKISSLDEEKHDLNSKLLEYVENNRQLASKIASEKNDKQNLLSAREGDMKGLVDELVNLREQHKSLKQHYLQSQDELDFERGAKHQIMSEKERDAGEISCLKIEVARLQNDLLMEKNEVALKECELKTLKSEIAEMKLAEDNLTTTFLLKEEFCDAQAIAEVEKIEIIAAKDEEINRLNATLKNVSDNLNRLVGEMPDVGILTPDVGLDEKIDSVVDYLKIINDRVDSVQATNKELLVRIETDNLKICELNELERSLQKTKEDNDSLQLKLEESQLKCEVMTEEIESWKNKNRALASSYSTVERNANEAKLSAERYDESKRKTEREVKELQEELNEKTNLIESINRNFRAIEKFVDKSVGKHAPLNDDSKIRSSEKLNSDLESFRKSVEELNASKEKLEKELVSLKAINEDLKKEHNRLIEESHSLKEENINLKEQEKRIEAQLNSLRKELDEVKRKENDVRTQLVSLEIENRDLKQKGTINPEFDSLKEQLSNLMTSECDVKAQLENVKKVNQKLEKSEKNLRTRFESLNKECASLKESESCVKSKFKSLIAENDNLKVNKNTLAANLESLKLENNRMKEIEKNLTTQLESIKTDRLNVKEHVTFQNDAPIKTEHTKENDLQRLECEIRALQERNKYLRKKASKSKRCSTANEDGKGLKTEISRLKKVNLEVVSELEKMRQLQKFVSSERNSITLKDELAYLRTELSKSEKLKSTVDGLLQAAKQEMENALAEMKVLRSENATLEKRASKTAFENENLREQLVKIEKEKGEILDRLNQMSGEKSVTDYKLRMSLVVSKNIEDKEGELKQLQEKLEELKEEFSTARNRLAESEHQLTLTKLNEDTLKSDLSSKCQQLEELQKEMKASQKMQRELMEEKLALVKVMEKHFNDQSHEDRQEIVAENGSLKKEVRMYQQRLENKCEKVAALDKRVYNLEGLLVKVVDNKISGQLELEDLRNALINKDYNAFDIIAGVYLPHHLEYLVRKARTLTENYRIPYDIDLLSEESKIIFRHLVLKAVATVNRTILDKWITKIENQSKWSNEDERDLPWKVDFERSNGLENRGCESLPEPDNVLHTASNIGIKKKADGTLDPIEWRKTLIQRHVRGMRDDYRVLIKYFGTEEDSAIYAILERIRAAVDRLEQVTSTVSCDGVC